MNRRTKQISGAVAGAVILGVIGGAMPANAAPQAPGELASQQAAHATPNAQVSPMWLGDIAHHVVNGAKDISAVAGGVKAVYDGGKWVAGKVARSAAPVAEEAAVAAAEAAAAAPLVATRDGAPVDTTDARFN